MFVKGFLLSKARVKDSTPSNLFKGESISLRGCAKGLFSGNSELVELANLVNAVTVLGEDLIDARRYQTLLLRAGNGDLRIEGGCDDQIRWYA